MHGFGLTTPASSSAPRRFVGRKTDRQAFTLVELLVVIVIIGILIALLVPTIGAAMRAAKVARVGIEVSNLASAVEAYRTEMNAYPPDFAVPVTVPQQDPFVTKQMTTHLARKFRHRDPRDQTQISVTGLDPSEALVFWLSGFSASAKFPLSAREPLDPAVSTIPLKGSKAFFDFDQTRLKDLDGDGYPEYYPEDSETPYVYIRSDSYGTVGAGGLLQPNVFAVRRSANASGVPVKPYAAELEGTAVKRFAEAEKYQILCAGADGEFGAGVSTTVAVFPDGIGYADVDEDNITNFSEGKTLEDSIP